LIRGIALRISHAPETERCIALGLLGVALTAGGNKTLRIHRPDNFSKDWGSFPVNEGSSADMTPHLLSLS
jgi:hypothetical protein